MKGQRLGLLAIVLALASGAAAADEPSILRRPFTAEEIRDEWIVGFTLKIRTTSPDGAAVERWTVIDADADGVEIEYLTLGPEGRMVGEPRVARSSWVELRDHATFPAATSALTRVKRQTPLGAHDGWLYTVRDEEAETVSEFFFVKEFPGAPLFVSRLRGGEPIMEMSQLERFRPRTAGGATAPACRTVEGLEPLVQPGSVLLLGELHGTAESPAFVSDAACHAVERGRSVTVALELPQTEQSLVQAFLDSNGGTAARQALLAGSFWSRSYQDGRTSRAMLWLLDDLRLLRRAKKPVRVLLLDRPEAGRERDRVMAARLLESVAASPKDVLVALTGNLHTRKGSGSGRMGAIVAEGLPDASVVSLDVAHRGGQAWICNASGCGPASVGGRSRSDWPRVELFAKVPPSAYDGAYHVGRVTASPPAVAN